MFATPALAHSTYALMGPTMKKLEKMKTYADQVIQKKTRYRRRFTAPQTAVML